MGTTNTTTPPKDVPHPTEAFDEVDGDMLLSQFEDEMLFDEKYGDLEVGEMAQITSTTPFLNSQISTISTLSSVNLHKRAATEDVVDPDASESLTTLALPPAKKLTMLALQTIIAGPSNRKRDLQGIQMGKLPRSTSLSTIVPLMFCPDFKGLMAQNSKFLPTISNAICSSWVRNVQGVVLRQKLIMLSNAKVSEYHNGNGEKGSAERLVSVVQARLWRMMQRTLCDGEAAKKLWKKHEGQEDEHSNMKEDDCGDEDLLGENGHDEDIHMRKDRLEDFVGMDDDDELLFGELLGGRDHESTNGLLENLGEQERLAVEAETEMLLGSDPNRTSPDEVDEEDELLLLSVGTPVERMLL